MDKACGFIYLKTMELDVSKSASYEKILRKGGFMSLKKIPIVLAMAVLVLPFNLTAEEGGQKIVAIGDVDAGYSISGQKAYDVKETIQINLKKEIEKLCKQNCTVKIVSPAVVVEGQKAEDVEDFPEMPTNRPPTQKEMAKYIAAMRQMQKQMTGELKTHKPVDADYYFDFKVTSGQSDTDTGQAAYTFETLTGINTSPADLSMKSTKIYLTATRRDPKTGTLIDKYTAKASSTKVRNLAGYTSYDYGDDEITRERLFSSAIKNCAKWISKQIQ